MLGARDRGFAAVPSGPSLPLALLARRSAGSLRFARVCGFDARWGYSVWRRKSSRLMTRNRGLPLARKAEIVKYPLVVAPVGLHLDAQVEVDLAVQRRLELLARL